MMQLRRDLYPGAASSTPSPPSAMQQTNIDRVDLTKDNSISLDDSIEITTKLPSSGDNQKSSCSLQIPVRTQNSSIAVKRPSYSEVAATNLKSDHNHVLTRQTSALLPVGTPPEMIMKNFSQTLRTRILRH